MIDINAFRTQLQNYYNGLATSVPSASRMANHCLELQKNRLDRLGYVIRFAIKDNSGFNLHSNEGFGDEKYNIACYIDHVVLTKAFFKNNQKVTSYTDEKQLYIYAEDLKIPSPDGSDVTNCPNCGAPQSLRELSTGCKFCGTHFEMSDLYPIVNNFFFSDTYSIAPEKANTRNPAGIVKLYAEGYKKLFKMMTKLPETVSAVSHGALTSVKRFEEFMKPHRPDFSYLHFGDEAIFMTLTLLYSDDPASLPFVKIDNCQAIAPNVVDLEYSAITIEDDNYSINGNIATVNVLFYANSYTASASGISRSKVKYRVTFERDITAPVNFNFSFTRINCPSCGSVFDAVKSPSCPFCSTKYQMNNEEWVITAIQKL